MPEVIIDGDEPRARTKLRQHHERRIAHVHLRIFCQKFAHPVWMLGENWNKLQTTFAKKDNEFMQCRSKIA